MIYIHSTIRIKGGTLQDYVKARKELWLPHIQEDADMRLVGFWQTAHGGGLSYEMILLTALPDAAEYGKVLKRGRENPALREWRRVAAEYQKTVVSKLMLPASWSRMDADWEGELALSTGKRLFLHDTGWPYPGRLDEYVEALWRDWGQYSEKAGINRLVGCLYNAPGTGPQNEVAILQAFPGWEGWLQMKTPGVQHPGAFEWMQKGLTYRDDWQSRILQPVEWSPLR